MHNVVALETNPTSGTCCANFKNVVSAAGQGLYSSPGTGSGLRWDVGRTPGGLGGCLRAVGCLGVTLGSPLPSC